MLLVVYTFNFLDRQILAILAQPVKADLGLSDTQMGVLGGLAFALLFSTMAIPLGVLADRKGRARVIGWSLAVWSGFTALCGVATSFWQLFLFRLGVGIGEAGGVAPSYAIISETFPPEKRARAMATYSLGIPLGQAVGALFGAMIAAAVDWRLAFIVLGLAGLLVVLPFRRVVRDRPIAPEAVQVPVAQTFARLARLPVFWLMSLGAATGSLCGYGIAFWVPTLIQRSYGLTLVETGQFMAAQLLLAGTVGMYAGGFVADRIGTRDRAGYARVGAIAYALSFPLMALAFLSTDLVALFLILLLPSGLIYVWLGPTTTAIQHLVPANERATASACYLFVNNGIGLTFGSLAVGGLSDALAPYYGAESLRWAVIAVCSLYLLAALFMTLAAPRLRKAWID
ncbi:MFS transporter [Novosphingobium sp. TH158]|uniref:spinster family MFS transporter n=1 Tax=Novosphingobium sp. TH158 TaxID=2067455 RepID=UPI000C7C50CA|nr:MFS transporter [Novosphingobium sp. TH158]PLK27940.1 MFS transporter [Novosphingobium sp. TH158]